MRYTPTPVCDARSARWQNRPGGVPENLTKNAAPEAVDLLRTGTRELHHGPGRLQPHIEAEYICADGQPVALITLVRRGRTLHNFSTGSNWSPPQEVGAMGLGGGLFAGGAGARPAGFEQVRGAVDPPV